MPKIKLEYNKSYVIDDIYKLPLDIPYYLKKESWDRGDGAFIEEVRLFRDFDSLFEFVVKDVSEIDDVLDCEDSYNDYDDYCENSLFCTINDECIDTEEECTYYICGLNKKELNKLVKSCKSERNKNSTKN